MSQYKCDKKKCKHNSWVDNHNRRCVLSHRESAECSRWNYVRYEERPYKDAMCKLFGGTFDGPTA